MGKAPSPPDPYQTAAAQTQSNQQTAAYNAALNRVSTYTPYGNLVYSETGQDSTGAPNYRADVSLTPQTQDQLSTQQAQNSAIAHLGLGLTDQIGSTINSPVPDIATSGKAAQDAYYAKEASYLDPQYGNLQNDLNSSLANKGVIEGTDAWNRAQEELGRQRTQAYGVAQNTAIQNGQTSQAQALANALTIKNQPLNQLSALRSGTQIQNPSFPTAPQANAAGTDVAGLVNSNYQSQVANSNNLMNGLFSLGSAALMASDRRLKRDIHRIGRSRSGLPIYRYRYRTDPTWRVGVMAQDVRKVQPGAVFTMPSGFMAVNYAALT